MPYTIDWIGSVAFGVTDEAGNPFAFSLEEDQRVPEDFKPGDQVGISNHPAHPAVLVMGTKNNGHYDFIHLKTGTEFRTWHRADMYKVESDSAVPSQPAE
jgi:hypothetical protein